MPIALHSLILAVDTVTQTVPQSGSSGQANDSILFAIITGLGVALAGIGVQFVFRRQMKDKLIAEASDQLIAGAKSMLEEYRRELATSKQELQRVRERVSTLESELRMAKEQRDRIESERREAIRDLGRLEQRVNTLQRMLVRLGADPESPYAPRTPPSFGQTEHD